MLDILEKRKNELQSLFDNAKDQLNHLLGRLTETKELYETVKKATAEQVVDGVLSGLEKVKADEDAVSAPAPTENSTEGK